MTPKWSANKVSPFVKISLDNKKRQILYQKISQKNPWFSHHQVRKWLRRNAPWETTWYSPSARKTSSMIRRSSWARTKHQTETFYHALLEICTHRWSTKRETLWQAWEKGNMRTKIGQFLKKIQIISIFYCSLHKGWTEAHFSHSRKKNFNNTAERKEAIEVRFNCR